MAKMVRNHIENKLFFNAWMAPEDIPGGSNYAEAIPEGIENCKALILILTEAAQGSKWVRREVEGALKAGKVVIPFMVERCELTDEFALLLQHINIIYACDDMMRALNGLHVLIGSLPGVKRVHPLARKMQNDMKRARTRLPDTGPDFISLGISDEKEQIQYCIDLVKNIEADGGNASAQEKRKAFGFIKWAAEKEDAEAMYLLGKLLEDGFVPFVNGAKPSGRKYLYEASLEGYEEAKACLDRICRKQYYEDITKDKEIPEPHPLTDSDGWMFAIKERKNRSGVTSKLVYDRGINILYIKVRVNMVIDQSCAEDMEMLKMSVENGFKSWAGLFQVFGNQLIEVKVNVEFTEDTIGAVAIRQMLPVDKRLRFLPLVTPTTEAIARARGEGKYSVTLFDRKKWSRSCKKTVYLDNSMGVLDCKKVQKAIMHEAGHIFGLGDLENVAWKTYQELDPYWIYDDKYNLVMSRNGGLVSNNDIEMMLLAFDKNMVQDYHGENTSKALGRGN